MRTFKKILVVILCVLIVFLCAGLILGIGSRETFLFRGGNTLQSYELAMEKEIEPEGIDGLEIQFGMNSNSVYFYESEGENIVVREYLNFDAEENQLSTLERKDSRLLIKGKRRNTFAFISIGNRHNGYIEVYMPAGFKPELFVVTVSGDVRAEGEPAWGDSFHVSTTSGDIYFPTVSSKEVKLSSTSGDIRLEHAAGRSIKASTTSGDISLGQTDGGLTVSSTSGDVHIMGGEGERSVSTVSGEIHLDEINGGFDLSSTSGDIAVASGKSRGRANTVSGDVRIFFSELTGSLDIGTTSGEVDLKLPAEVSLTLEFSSVSGEAETFFDNALSFNKRGTHAEGSYGGGDNEITISTVSGGLRITEW